MMELTSNQCYQCDGPKIVLIYDRHGMVRTESVYQVHFLKISETWEIACGKCGLLYSRQSVSTLQQFDREVPNA